MDWRAVAATVADATGVIIIAVAALVAFIQMMQAVAAWMRFASRPAPHRAFTPTLWRALEPMAPRVAIIVPAYNEAATIVPCLQALLALEYSRAEVVVVSDGSTDDTVSQVIKAFGLAPADVSVSAAGLTHQPIRSRWRGERLTLIDKANGGKSDALNAGIAQVAAPLVVVLDADTIPERGALFTAVQPFLRSPGHVLAVGGSIRIGNGLALDAGHIAGARPPRSLIGLIQTVEYLRTFHVARPAAASFGAVGLISGAFGVFDRAALVEIGGYSTRTVGEDYELVLRLHRLAAARGLKAAIRQAPDAIAWTEGPSSLAVLSRQRRRWQRGAVETLSRHRDMIGSGRFGGVGLVALPEAVLVDLVAPVATVGGATALATATLFGVLSIDWLIAFFVLTAGFGLFQSAVALALEDVRFRRFPGYRAWGALCFAALVEAFGYRQLCDGWRVAGLIEALTGKTGWGAMERAGFSRVGDVVQR